MDVLKKILEIVSTDERIENGIFDYTNIDHIEILKEFLLKNCEDTDSVNKFINEVSNASKVAKSKGLEYRRIKNGSGWYRGNQLVGKTVKGEFKTLSQIEHDKKIEDRKKEIEKQRERDARKIEDEREELENKYSKNNKPIISVDGNESLEKKNLSEEKDQIKNDYVDISTLKEMIRNGFMVMVDVDTKNLDEEKKKYLDVYKKLL